MQSYTSASTTHIGRSAFESGALPAEFIVLVGRVLMGGIFVLSGWAKLMGLSAFAASLQKNGVPAPQVLAVIGACVEFFGGLAIVLGLGVRYVAFLMIAFVVVATLISHRYWELAEPARRLQEINFTKNAAIIGGFLLMSVVGSGRIALDAALARRLG